MALFSGDEIKKIRIEKLNKIKKQGINPYPYMFKITHSVTQIRSMFSNLKSEQTPSDEISTAGRIMSIREMGKASFAHIKQAGERLQLYFKKDLLGEKDYQFFKTLDIGDFIGVSGSVFITKTGELTLKIKKFFLLAKSIKPLPEKWHGLKDVEIRYRQRYLDILVNDEVRRVFITRTKIIKAIKKFLDQKGFLEVETPMMQPIPGGARARPFVTHHNALDRDLFLRIAPELYLKRLIVAGIDKVYELNRSFRNEGISIRHNPEFTMLEVYQAYIDYYGMMQLCEQIIAAVVKEIFGEERIFYKGNEIPFTSPWQRKSFFEILREKTKVDFLSLNNKEIEKKARSLDIKFTPEDSTFKILESIFETVVQPELIQPTIIYDYPKESSPLAKTHRNDPRLVERFEVFIGKEEIANAYTELNDPQEQRERMQLQLQQKEKGDEEAQYLDEDYIKALEYGMPPCAGLGIGIDRLIMILTDKTSIREVILFPQLRPTNNNRER